MGMQKFFFFIITMIYLQPAYADKAKDVRSELVKELKVLFKQNKNSWSYEDKLIYSVFYQRKSFEANASSNNYDCIYGGWPSSSISVGDKRYCTHPSRIQSQYYDNAQHSCDENQLPCPEALFGNNVCISKRDRLNSYDRCEEEGSEPFLQDGFGGDDHVMMLEYIQIAKSICDPDNSNSMKMNCEKTMEKIELINNF